MDTWWACVEHAQSALSRVKFFCSTSHKCILSMQTNLKGMDQLYDLQMNNTTRFTYNLTRPLNFGWIYLLSITSMICLFRSVVFCSFICSSNDKRKVWAGHRRIYCLFSGEKFSDSCWGIILVGDRTYIKWSGKLALQKLHLRNYESI